MDDFLQHYASPYYDPVKAHEYYMRTRELKGRRSASKLSDTGKEVWTYTKNSIKEEEKAEIETAKNERDSQNKAHREKAEETRKRISSKLKKLNEALAAKAKAKRLQTSEDTNSKIKALREKEIPKGISKEE